MSSIKVVIPARYGSSRLPGKPLLDVCEKPIFWHVFQRCVEAGVSPVDIIVATDDLRIYTKATSLCIPVVMTSECHESGTDRINEVALKFGWSDDVVVINVQGDEPAIPPELIASLKSFTMEQVSFSITTAMTPIRTHEELHNVNVVKAIVSEHHHALYFTRAASPFCRDNPDDFSLAYRHIGIYAYRVASLRRFCSYSKSLLEEYEKLEQLRALSHGMTIGVIIYDHELPLGVDTIEDYLNVKEFMESRQ
ncbi:3-deoxy-manno-octulosonate cytidylyltransferase [Aeromonas veronii]|uniref:3-deoxy-manno-octulosonate cytidylyltransferase n=1 Tax=Aeromonas veronii TaxID=654 RepID=UPI003F7447C0